MGPPLAEATSIQLVAVQMRLDINDFWTRSGFEMKIRRLMEQVAAQTDRHLPALVVFPEDVGLLLVAQGMQRHLTGVRSIDTALKTAIKTYLLPLAVTRSLHRLAWVPALFFHRNQIIAETYFDVFAHLAREYQVYLVAGSVVLPPYSLTDGQVQWRAGPIEHRVYNTSYFFGPDGRVIGRQDKVFLIDLEKEGALHLNGGALESLRAFETPLGRVGIAICFDAFQNEVIDALSRQRAQILVQPSANVGRWNAEQQVDWLRSSYQRTFTEGRFEYAVNPMLNGPLWDIGFFGQSSIVAKEPNGLPAAGPRGVGYQDLEPAKGFIRVASSDRSEEILVAAVPHPHAQGDPNRTGCGK